MHIWWIFRVHISASTRHHRSNVTFRVIGMIVWVLPGDDKWKWWWHFSWFYWISFLSLPDTYTCTHTYMHYPGLPNFWHRYALIMQHFPFTLPAVESEFMQIFGQICSAEWIYFVTHIHDPPYWRKWMSVCYARHIHAIFSSVIQVQLKGGICHVISI